MVGWWDYASIEQIPLNTDTQGICPACLKPLEAVSRLALNGSRRGDVKLFAGWILLCFTFARVGVSDVVLLASGEASRIDERLKMREH